MLSKHPKKSPLLARVVGGAIIVEALIFGGAYFIWNKLNKSRDFRRTIQEDYPWILDKFYWIGEKADDHYALRRLDQIVWASSEAKAADASNPKNQT